VKWRILTTAQETGTATNVMMKIALNGTEDAGTTVFVRG
jgi:hypothetical protein